MKHQGRIDGLAFFGLAFLLFLAFNIVKDLGLIEPGSKHRAWAASVQDQDSSILIITGSQNNSVHPTNSNQPAGSITALKTDADPSAITPPYAHYFLTQGPHGMDYGHNAIDISAGKGEPILSPIDGWVENLFIDEWGNPTLVLENERYQIELLHGVYSVNTGDPVLRGQPVGLESNQGNTIDAAGISCRGRDCGYHTHINVYDKSIGVNLNPLNLFPTQQ